jgi:hypothetical protein
VFHALWKPDEIIAFSKACDETEERVEKELNNFERTLSQDDRTLSQEARVRTARELNKMQKDLAQIRIMRLQIEAVWKHQTDTQRLQILQWVSGIPYMDHHRNAANGRTSDTGTWLLQYPSFQAWESSLSPMILWLHGIRESLPTPVESSDFEKQLAPGRLNLLLVSLITSNKKPATKVWHTSIATTVRSRAV